MTDYNKLVRDKIPEIIKAKGEKVEFHRADDPEFLEKARAKLREETDEFIQSNDPDELADLLEITYAVAGAMGLSEADLNQRRQLKHQERGGFDKKIILEKA